MTLGTLNTAAGTTAPKWRRFCPVRRWLVILLALGGLSSGLAVDTLTWNTNRDLVSADIHSGGLLPTLEAIAGATGWHVFLEPQIKHKVSAKFKDIPPGEALHRLLGDVNFALIPGTTNSIPRLFVFRTSRQSATQTVRGTPKPRETAESKRIGNELIVRLKPGANIDEIAKLLGAKVIGRMDKLNAYRLQFDDDAKADAARTELASNSQIDSVENNYTIDRPEAPPQIASGNVPPPPHLDLKPPPDNGRVIIGLVDTAVQPLGNDLDKFLLKQISEAGQASLDPNSPEHGTSMAETMLRSLEGVTKGSTAVQILPVDVFGNQANTTTFDVANGIALAVNNGAKIVNLSLGSPGDSPLLRQVVNDALNSNILLYAAGGNDPQATQMFPAAIKGVDGVTALEMTQNGVQIASWATKGAYSLGAPATSVVYFGGKPYYVVGTSPASAYVSGAAAGVMESKGSSPQQTDQIIHTQLGIPVKTSGP
jgi:Subtilase family